MSHIQHTCWICNIINMIRVGGGGGGGGGGGAWHINLAVSQIMCNSTVLVNVFFFHGSWRILQLTHWGRVTHICVGNLTIIGPDNGLSPGRRQAIIWTNAGILLIGPWGTNFNEILIGIQTFSFTKMHLKMSSVKWRPFCLGLNVFTMWSTQWQPVEHPHGWPVTRETFPCDYAIIINLHVSCSNM